MTKNKGAMTVAEAGRKGGATTAQRHGPEFYEQIGKKGGRTTAQRHGADFYEQIGKQGGQKVKETYDYIVIVGDYDITNAGKDYRHNDFHIIPRGVIRQLTVLRDPSELVSLDVVTAK